LLAQATTNADASSQEASGALDAFSERMAAKSKRNEIEKKNMQSRHLERIGQMDESPRPAVPNKLAEDGTVPLPPAPFPPDPTMSHESEGSTCKQLVKIARESSTSPGLVLESSLSSKALPFNVPMPPVPFPRHEDVGDDACLSPAIPCASSATPIAEHEPEEAKMGNEDKGDLGRISIETSGEIRVDERNSNAFSSIGVAKTMHKAGYLFKYGKVSALTKKYDWKKRYCVLIDSQLTSFRDKKEFDNSKAAMKAHVFDIKRCDVSDGGELSCDFELVETSVELVKTVNVEKQRVLKLRAALPSDKDEWVKTIKSIKSG